LLTDPASGSASLSNSSWMALGASNHSYAEATATQQLLTVSRATTRERSPATAGPGRSCLGRLKSAVTIPCRCEPGIHRTYAELAAR